MVRKRSKTPTRIERKQNYILKKYYILQEKIYNNNLNIHVNVTDEDILHLFQFKTSSFKSKGFGLNQVKTIVRGFVSPYDGPIFSNQQQPLNCLWDYRLVKD